MYTIVPAEIPAGAADLKERLTRFFDTILPNTGKRCVTTIGAEVTRQRFFDTNAEAAAFALEVDREGALQVYHACASYKDGSSRRASNALAARAFWLDIDCGPSKPYADQGKAIQALKAFCTQIDLRLPMIVLSGAGVHCYWTLTQDVSAADWLPVAKALKRATQALGLEADPSRTADIASVLRPPGSLNKKRATPEEVQVRYAGGPIDLATMQAKLEPYVHADDVNPLGPRPAYITAELNDDLKGNTAHAPAWADRVADGCAVVRSVRDYDPNNRPDEPTWHGVLGVLKKCEDGEQAAHDWSAQDDRYDPSDTQARFDRVIGPTTCATLESMHPALCRACPHYGEVKSPITLGEDRASKSIVPQHASVSATSVASLPGTTGITAIAHRLSIEAAREEARRFPFVMDFGGQATITTVSGGRLRPLKTSEFKDMISDRYVSVPVEGGPQLVPFFSWYMKSGDRPEFDRAAYFPEGVPPWLGGSTLNTFTGFDRSPHRGKWERMKQHLFRVICGGDREVFKFLLQWLAHAVQRPGTAPGSVPVLVSAAEGTGKTTVGNWMCSIFGRHSISLNTAEQLLGKFNSHLADISFLLVNEPAFVGNHEAQRKFKSMITDSVWLIEGKFQPTYQVPNIAHIMLTTNERQAVPAGSHARRFLVLDVDDAHAGDTAYFDALYKEANEGGTEAMLHALLGIDLSGFNPSIVPTTAALRRQQEQSAPVEVQWALDTIDDPDAHDVHFGQFNASANLHRSLRAFAELHRLRVPTMKQFGMWLASLGLRPATGPSPTTSGRGRGWTLPDATIFDAAVRRAAGIR